MSCKSKRYSARFRTSMVLQSLTGKQERKTLCQEQGLNPELLSQWEHQFVFAIADDPIRGHCLKMGYADHVVLGGLEGRAMWWQEHVRCLVNDKHYRSGHFDYYVYLNDMDGRRVLQECLNLADEKQLQRLVPMLKALLPGVEAADEQFMMLTEPTEKCILEKQFAEERNYTPEKHWWYYRRPKAAKEADPLWQRIT